MAAVRGWAHADYHAQPMSVIVREATDDDDEIVAAVIAGAFRTVADRFGLDESNCPKHPSNCRAAWVEQHRARGACRFDHLPFLVLFMARDL